MKSAGWLAAYLTTAAVAVGIEAASPAYSTGPPPGVTGGFGEGTCVQCHVGSPLDEPGTSVTLEGVPSRYEPGKHYRIRVYVARKGDSLQVAGFQLSSRFGDGDSQGRQAGEFRPLGKRVRLTHDTTTGVQYAEHSVFGTGTAADGRGTWQLEWIAPAERKGQVIFNAAGNASNADDSPIGDHIATTMEKSAGH